MNHENMYILSNIIESKYGLIFPLIVSLPMTIATNIILYTKPIGDNCAYVRDYVFAYSIYSGLTILITIISYYVRERKECSLFHYFFVAIDLILLQIALLVGSLIYADMSQECVQIYEDKYIHLWYMFIAILWIVIAFWITVSCCSWYLMCCEPYRRVYRQSTNELDYQYQKANEYYL